MVKNNKKSKKNLGKKNKKSHKKTHKRTLKKSKTCKSCNFIRFGGCPDCGASTVSGGSAACSKCNGKIKLGGNHYPINTYNDDVSRAPFLKSSTLLGDFSRVNGGKRKSIKIRQYKKGGGILDFFSYPSNDYVTTHNTLGGVNTQRDILAGNSLSNSDPRFQPVLNRPYGVTNPPLV